MDVERMIRQCSLCASVNPGKQDQAPAKALVVEEPMDRLAMDLLALPKTDTGSIGVAVIIDVFTKYAWVKPLKDKTSRSVVQALLEVMGEFGRFRVLQTDNGGEFASQLLEDFCAESGVTQLFVSPYNPRANGVVERLNETLVCMLRKLAQWNPRAWEEFLPIAMHAYRSKVHTATGYSPFHLMFGRESSLVKEWRLEEIPVMEEAEQILHHMQRMVKLKLHTYQKARVNLHKEADRRKAIQDGRHGKMVRATSIPDGA